MAIKALDINKVRDYVCKDDDPDDPTTFKLGTLSARDKGAIQDTMTSFSFSDEDLARAQSRKDGKAAPSGDDDEEGSGGLDTKVEKSKMHFEAVRRGLKGWENFLDPTTGAPIQFRFVTRDVGGGVKKSVVPNELLDRLPYSVMQELAEHILSDSLTDEDEGGNSQEPSTGGSSTPTENAEPA